MGSGRALSGAFARSGARVVIADRRRMQPGNWPGRSSAKPGRGAAIAIDVRDAAAVEDAVVREATRPLRQIDVLVNNAGIYPNTPVVEMDEVEWDAVFDTNVKGMFLVSRAVARQMIERGAGGRIVNISSGAAESGRIGAAHYCSSKAAVNMFTKVLALELAQYDIAVNAVATRLDRGPGLVAVAGVHRRPGRRDADGAHRPTGGHRAGGLLSRFPGGDLHHRHDPGRRWRGHGGAAVAAIG